MRAASEQRRIQTVHGFGAKSERQILEARTAFLGKDRRYTWVDVAHVAEALLSDLKEVPGLHKAVAAGSLRRRCETVGDLDLVVTTERPREVMDRLTAGENVLRVLAKGVTRCSTLCRNSGVQVDLRGIWRTRMT